MTEYGLIISQGRVADRTDGALAGARATGDALARYLDLEPTVVGTPEPSTDDDWTVSLPAAAATLDGLRDAVAAVLDDGRTPLLATNTCAASLGTLPTVAERYPDAVVLWIDAHGDFNTPATTGSGYLGGMVVAAACGLWDSGHGAGLDPSNVVLVGARDIDPAERELLDDAGVRILPPALSTPERVNSIVAGRPVWIHIDWDVLEPGFIPAAYRVADGLLPHEVASILAELPAGTVRGVELAEFEYDAPEAPSRVSLELVIETFQQLDRAQRHRGA
ncbi:arginase family protein [Pseudoclavibacter chungangensis]|uniref:Arginase family protein n=1 Tax=Pseudoclavibacter chungangensis TaxID=587635 RepID=A0A7J5C1A3_9MICO|nr:arginase family protein [Pseudoclavibacter chungangensis]KAB1662384.1 arginase family protein [Pseudoclavibacter chungangensis]NYJ68405.1 arginase/N-omega-hydroxy-L-arginine amidinohydrolase [Pseudoclavibacter chungangensis]